MLLAAAHFLPNTEHDRMHLEVETVEEFLAQERLDQAQAPDALDVLVPVPDLAHRADEIWTQLRGTGPGGGLAGRGEATYSGTLLKSVAISSSSPAVLVRPTGGEDVVGPQTEQQGVGALVAGSDLRGPWSRRAGVPAGRRTGSPLRLRRGPPGICPTRSRVTNSSMWIRPMARLPMKWDVSVAEINCGRGADSLLQRPLASCVTALRGASVTPSRGRGPCPLFTPPGRGGAPVRSL